MASQPTRAQLAALVDHTLLKPEATNADVAALVAEAAELGVYAVCVSPSMVPVAVQAGGGVRVASVAGFPSGKHVSEVKAHEAAQAVASGASEVDMVIDIGAALAGDIDAVRADIEAVRAAVAGAVLKVIVESAVLLARADERTLVQVCRRRRGRRSRLRQDVDRVSSRGRRLGACRRFDEPDRRRPARCQGQRRHPDCRRCDRDAGLRVPPGWACRAPERCSTGSVRTRRQRLAKQGLVLPVGMLAF